MNTSCSVRISCGERAGTATVITGGLVLTCEHVVSGQAEVDVRAPSGQARRFAIRDSDVELDVALLEPCEPDMSLPASSCAVPRYLWRGTWPAFEETIAELCTDDAQTLRSMPVELRHARPGTTRVPFGVPSPREGIRPGYSGAPVLHVSRATAVPRLLGIVRARDEHSVDDLDAAESGWLVPIDAIAMRFGEVASVVESPIERDTAWGQHWEPRSRGVASSGEPGFFFAGRQDAYARLVEHLARGAGLLAVVGPRGCGKSALLARGVVLAGARYLQLLAEHRGEAVGGYGELEARVDAAVLGRAKTSAAVACEISEQLGLGACTADELIAALEREDLRPAIVVDAVDESAELSVMMRELVVPLAQAGARVAIGSLRQRLRRSEIEAETAWVDLDSPEYGDDAIPGYVRRRLLAARTYDESTATQVAAVAGARAAGNFLAAELMARTLASGEPIDTSVEGWQSSIANGVGGAFYSYLSRFGEESDRILALLSPLAYARGDGLTIDPGEAWIETANRLRPDELDPIAQRDLRKAAQNAADYLIVAAADGARRLYHEGLADAIRELTAERRLAQTGRPATEEAIRDEMSRADSEFVNGLVELLPRAVDAPAAEYLELDPYVRSHLPTHLAEQERAVELLNRPGLLLSADAEAVRGALTADVLNIPPERDAERLATVHALGQPEPPGVSRRAAALCAALLRQRADEPAGRVARALGTPDGLPYRFVTGPPLPSFLVTIPAIHADGCSALIVVQDEDEPLIISAGLDAVIRSWRLDGSPGPFYQQAQVAGRLLLTQHEGQPVVVSIGMHKQLSSWRLDGSAGPLQLHVSTSLQARYATVTEHEQRRLIVIGGVDRVLRSWWLDGGEPGPLQVELEGEITSLESIEYEGTQLVIGGDEFGQLLSWRPNGSCGPLEKRHAHDAAIAVLGIATLRDGRQLIISGGEDGALRSWFPDGRPGLFELEGVAPLRELLVIHYKGGPLVIATPRGGGSVHTWRLAGQPGPLIERAHASEIFALGAVEHDGSEPVIVTGAMDGTVRTWRLNAGGGLRDGESADGEEIEALTSISCEGRPLIAAADALGALRSWWPDGSCGPLDLVTDGEIRRLLATEYEGEPLFIAACTSGTGLNSLFGDSVLKSWRLDGSPGALEQSVTGSITSLVLAECQGRALIVAAHRTEREALEVGGVTLSSWWLNGEPGPLSRNCRDVARLIGLATVASGESSLLIGIDSSASLHSWRVDGHENLPSKRIADKDELESIAAFTGGDGEPLIVASDRRGALRSWYIDGRPGPLDRPEAIDYRFTSLAVIECEGQPVVVGGLPTGISSWRLDGSPGPIQYRGSQIEELTVAEQDGRAVALVSRDRDNVVLVHHIPAT